MQTVGKNTLKLLLEVSILLKYVKRPTSPKCFQIPLMKSLSETKWTMSVDLSKLNRSAQDKKESSFLKKKRQLQRILFSFSSPKIVTLSGTRAFRGTLLYHFIQLTQISLPDLYDVRRALPRLVELCCEIHNHEIM